MPDDAVRLISDECTEYGCWCLGRSVNEVFLSLGCMSVGACCCSCREEECLHAFRAVCFKDSVF